MFLQKKPLLQQISKTFERKLLKLYESFERKAENLRWKHSEPYLYQAEIEFNTITDHFSKLKKKKKISKRELLLISKALKLIDKYYNADPETAEELIKQAKYIFNKRNSTDFKNLKIDFTDLEKTINLLLESYLPPLK